MLSSLVHCCYTYNACCFCFRGRTSWFPFVWSLPALPLHITSRVHMLPEPLSKPPIAFSILALSRTVTTLSRLVRQLSLPTTVSPAPPTPGRIGPAPSASPTLTSSVAWSSLHAPLVDFGMSAGGLPPVLHPVQVTNQAKSPLVDRSLGLRQGPSAIIIPTANYV